MDGRRWIGAAGAVTVALTLSACAESGDVGLINDSHESVTVEYGGDVPEELPSGGGVVVLDVTECFDRPVAVTYTSGREDGLPGPLCPGDEVRITDDDVEVSDATSAG